VNRACSLLLFVSYLLLAQLRGSGRARRRWAITIAAPSKRSVKCRSMMATVRSLFLQQTDRNIWNTPTLRARPCHCAKGHVTMVLSSQHYFTSIIKSRKCPDLPWGPPSLVYNGFRVFLGGKAAGAWRWPPTPSSAECKKRVEMCPYFLCGPSWPVMGGNLPLRLEVLHLFANSGWALLTVCLPHPLVIVVVGG
jgi:hypothetical protein